jgi:hypothetical protein
LFKRQKREAIVFKNSEVKMELFNLHNQKSTVTVPYGRPNVRSRLHFGHNREGGQRSVCGDVVALKKIVVRPGVRSKEEPRFLELIHNGL